MSTTVIESTEEQIEAPPSGYSSIKASTISALTDPTELIKFLNRHDKLSDAAYEECVHDIGFRASLWIMRQAMAKGDLRTVNACKVYLDRVELSRSRAKADADPTRSVSSEFAPADRSAAAADEGEG